MAARAAVKAAAAKALRRRARAATQAKAARERSAHKALKVALAKVDQAEARAQPKGAARKMEVANGADKGIAVSVAETIGRGAAAITNAIGSLTGGRKKRSR